jgi:predicted ATPase
MRFERLLLQNWKNFRSVDVPLQSRTFVVGPNAAGKSNLLDAFRFLRDLAQPKGGGLQSAIDDHRLGFSHVRSLHAREKSNVVIAVDVGNGPATERWSYKLELTSDKRGAKVVKETAERDGERLVSRPDGKDRDDPERLRQTHLEQVSENQSFRRLSDFFAGVTYLHLVPQLLREPRRFDVVGRDPLGSDFLRRISETTKKTRDARLRRICEALRVAVPALRQLELWMDASGAPHLRGQFEHWRPNAGWQTEPQFSDGTLRLLALLWILADGSDPLLLEEPELSLHPAVVREIPRMLHKVIRSRSRQVLLSTHSSDLLSDRGIAAEEILCVRPGKEGSEVTRAVDIEDVRDLLEAGHSPGEAVMPQAAPAGIHQLTL